MKKLANYARFYALIKAMPGNQTEIKEQLISQFTSGRTTSLREMTPKEYNQLCDALQGSEDRTQQQQALKAARSEVLRLMQQLGVDTTDWSKVDQFCLSPKITGKTFRQLTSEDLALLSKKLRAITRNGGLKDRTATEPSAAPTVKIPLIYNPNQIPS